MKCEQVCVASFFVEKKDKHTVVITPMYMNVPTHSFQSRNTLLTALLLSVSILARPEARESFATRSSRSSSVRNFAVSGQSTTQNLARAPTRQVRAPSRMKIHWRMLVAWCRRYKCCETEQQLQARITYAPTCIPTNIIHLGNCVS